MLMTSQVGSASAASMTRKLGVEYPCAIGDAVNRGDHRDPILQDGADRKRCLKTLGETRAQTGCRSVPGA